MRKLSFFIIITMLGLLSCGMKSNETSNNNRGKIRIQWVAHLSGDYSFRRYHTIQCEAWCYEWAGTDSIVVERENDGSLKCYTLTNAATHCTLAMSICHEYCFPQIELISVAPGGNMIFKCTGGSIKIDRERWAKGILKAEFDFNFDNPEDPSRPVYWRGKIYVRIKN